MCVCVCVRARALRIVCTKKMLRFISTLIIIDCYWPSSYTVTLLTGTHPHQPRFHSHASLTAVQPYLAALHTVALLTVVHQCQAALRLPPVVLFTSSR